MKPQSISNWISSFKSEDGQALPWVVLLTVLFLGMAGLTVDLGHAYVAYRELQASTDAAALAGAYAMTQSSATNATITSAVCSYSSNPTATAGCPAGVNGTPNLPVITVVPTLSCVGVSNYITATCSAAAIGKNVIKVVQTATVPTYFIRGLRAFGIRTADNLTLSSTSVATITATNTALNVAIVIDTTASMGGSDSDPNCGKTRIYCALQGVQTLLSELTPCQSGSTSLNCVGAYDQVSLFTYPNVQANTASNDTTCPSSNPTILPYYAPAQPTSSTNSWTAPTGASASYQLTGYVDNYSSTNQNGGTINTTSTLGIALGGSKVKNCGGLQTPGGDGTYYAGAINAAQTSLMAAQLSNPNSQNVMVILTDGDASASASKITGSSGKTGTTYGAATDQCQQAITAAQNATTLGTTVYTVAYGAQDSGCSTDTSGSMKGLSPCTAVKYMSSGWPSDTSHFFSDSTAGGAGGACPYSGASGLNNIFGAIGTQLSKARLVPLAAAS